MLTEDGQKLVMDNISLAYKWVAMTRGDRQDREERVSDAFLALCCAADKYDPSVGAFSTFAFHFLRNQRSTSFRSGMPKGFRNHKTTKDAPRVHQLGDEDFTAIYSDKGPGPEEDPDRRDFTEWLLDSLPDRLQSIVRMRFLDGMPQEDISRALGVSHQYVSQAVEKALNKLRNHHDKREATKDRERDALENMRKRVA